MIIPKYARYDRCVILSCEFLEEFSISRFPINPFAIIEEKKWGLITYTELANRNDCSIRDTVISLKSEDGFTIYNGDNFTIAYNNTKPRKRVLFTLLHEIGHIYLNHLIDFEHTTLYRGSLTKLENKVLENEANAFARNALSPSVFVMQLKDKSKRMLSGYFGISYDAAAARLELLDSDYQHVENAGIKERLRTLFYLFHNRHGCSNCSAIIFIKTPIYCPICGRKKLKWGDGKMIYPKLETDNEGRLKKCMICENEDIQGDYCHICGKELMNYCSNATLEEDEYKSCKYTNPLPSNARYCPMCGHESTFYQNKMLRKWDYDPSEDKNFMIIPEGIDEMLPFG